jgi:hypothetical protein
MEHPKCFVSYAWESEAHSKWVLRLAEVLHSKGVNIRLDQWDTRLGMDLPKYMEESIRESDYVLLICTPTFANKANESRGGVGYEKNVVTGELFTSRAKDTKFVPVLRIGSPDISLPSYLQSKIFIDFRQDVSFDGSLEQFLGHLHEAPLVVRPPLGPRPSFQSAGNISTHRSQLSDDPTPVKTCGHDVDDAGTRDFDLRRFTQLRDYAYRTSGLNLSSAEAVKWAEQRVRESPPFDLQRFTQLRDYAYRTSGLNLSSAEAVKCAEQRVRESPTFDLQRFIQLRGYAYRSNGLNLSSAEATKWALRHMK